MLLCKDIDNFVNFLKEHGIEDIWKEMHWNGCLHYDNKSVIWDYELNPIFKGWTREECCKTFEKKGIHFSAAYNNKCGNFMFIDDITKKCYHLKVNLHCYSEDEIDNDKIVDDYDSDNGDGLFTKVIDLYNYDFDFRLGEKMYKRVFNIIEKDGKFFQELFKP